MTTGNDFSTGPHALQIQPGAGAVALTPQQERFNALVREVAQWRAALAQWQQTLERYDQAVEPARRELLAAWQAWSSALEEASHLPGLTRAEVAQLGEWMREASGAAAEEEPERVERAHDPQPQAATVDDWEHWEQQAQAAAAERERQAASRRASRAGKRRREAGEDASQSVREVYRKLASILHPDREPDAQARERKTALMQQANQAYAQKNLLALLELQLQAEQVEMERLAGVDERRLQHYIEVLQEQATELQAEVRRLENEFREAVGLPSGAGLPPRKVDRAITAEARRMREDAQHLRRQAAMLADIDTLKDWLREERRA